VLLFPGDHQPALGHEYQFHIDAEDAETPLQRLISFVHARTTGPCFDPNVPNA